jgi:hypothetical protein
MNKTLKDSLDVIWYFMAFFLIQFIMIWAVRIGTNLATGQPLIDAANAASRPNGDALVLMMLFSSILTILVFGQFRWSPWSRDYLRSKPWLVVVWTIILSLGTILPSEWILESLQVRMSEAQVQMFEQIMGKPMGYIAIGILAPIAEEMCFRGAILRKLLTMFPKRQHWIAIAVSAVLFALAHFNVVQSLHAFLIGLLLGWLYYRTDSILPGIVFHWINNTVAYVMFNIMPQMDDGKLIDIFHGNHTEMLLALVFSLFIMIPAIVQLNQNMKPAAKKD